MSLPFVAGGGGLDLGVGLALRRMGRAHCAVLYVEREAYAASVLAARMEEGAMAAAPVWSDLTSLDGKRFRGRVDLVVAGVPCQGNSVAGKRRGRADDRWLWPVVEQLLADIEPEWFFLENVRGLLSVDGGAAFADILGSLARLGFDAEWCVLRASDVGAPHRRERVFLLARQSRALGVAQRAGLARRPMLGGDDRAQCSTAERAGGLNMADAGSLEGDLSASAREGLPAPSGHSCGVADTIGEGWGSAPRADEAERLGVGAEESARGVQCGGAAVRRFEVSGVHVADAERGELRDEQGRRGGESRQGAAEPGGDGALGHAPWPPGPADIDGWRAYLAEYPDLVPAIESAIRGGAYGLAGGVVESVADRADRLRLLGNGVVPEQAAAAFAELYGRFDV